jgi:hypothetical protein
MRPLYDPACETLARHFLDPRVGAIAAAQHETRVAILACVIQDAVDGYFLYTAEIDKRREILTAVAVDADADPL